MILEEAKKILKLKNEYTEEDAKIKRNELLKRWHPDKNNNSKESTEMTKKINIAYDIAIDYLNNLHLHSSTSNFSNTPDPFQDIRDFFEQMHSDFFNSHKQESAYRLERFLKDIQLPRNEESISINISIPIDDLFNKNTLSKTIKMRKLNNCPHCKGIKILLNKQAPCPICNGKGMKQISQGPYISMSTCNNCRGMGVIFDTCQNCDENGFISTFNDIEIPLMSEEDNGIIKVAHTLDDYGLPSKNKNPEKRGVINLQYRYIPNLVFTVRFKEKKFYISNQINIFVNLSDLIKQKTVEIPTYDYKKETIKPKRVKLPANIDLKNDIDHNDLSFMFLIDNCGIMINKTRMPYLAKININSIIK